MIKIKAFQTAEYIFNGSSKGAIEDAKAMAASMRYCDVTKDGEFVCTFYSTLIVHKYSEKFITKNCIKK